MAVHASWCDRARWCGKAVPGGQLARGFVPKGKSCAARCAWCSRRAVPTCTAGAGAMRARPLKRRWHAACALFGWMGNRAESSHSHTLGGSVEAGWLSGIRMLGRAWSGTALPCAHASMRLSAQQQRACAPPHAALVGPLGCIKPAVDLPQCASPRLPPACALTYSTSKMPPANSPGGRGRRQGPAGMRRRHGRGTQPWPCGPPC